MYTHIKYLLNPYRTCESHIERATAIWICTMFFIDCLFCRGLSWGPFPGNLPPFSVQIIYCQPCGIVTRRMDIPTYRSDPRMGLIGSKLSWLGKFDQILDHPEIFDFWFSFQAQAQNRAQIVDHLKNSKSWYFSKLACAHLHTAGSSIATSYSWSSLPLIQTVQPTCLPFYSLNLAGCLTEVQRHKDIVTQHPHQTHTKPAFLDVPVVIKAGTSLLPSFWIIKFLYKGSGKIFPRSPAAYFWQQKVLGELPRSPKLRVDNQGVWREPSEKLPSLILTSVGLGQAFQGACKLPGDLVTWCFMWVDPAEHLVTWWPGDPLEFHSKIESQQIFLQVKDQVDPRRGQGGFKFSGVWIFFKQILDNLYF